MDKSINILLVEDDPNLGFVTSDTLHQEGYNTTLAKDGEEGLHKFLSGDYDLCILDVMMPKVDGFTLAKDIRKANSIVPILFLTAKSMDEDKIEAFELGADDYMTKPFNIKELLLRVKAILKRYSINTVSENKRTVQSIGLYNFDYANLQLSINENHKKLTKKEADLLRILVLNKNNVVKRENILKAIWGEDDYFLGRSMDVFISKLRKYLKEDSSIQIENVHGVGFKLIY